MHIAFKHYTHHKSNKLNYSSDKLSYDHHISFCEKGKFDISGVINVDPYKGSLTNISIVGNCMNALIICI